MTTTRRTMAALHAMTLTVEDGVRLTGRTDLQLAEAWARHYRPDWQRLTWYEQSVEILAALRAIRAAVQQVLREVRAA